MPAIQRPPRGFTIVEMLVVVGVIAVLMGLVMTGLSTAKRQGRRTIERNHLRQIGYAWGMYAANENDATLPGFLSIGTQRSWRTRYRFEDGRVMSPAPEYVDERGGENNLAGTWTWRLLPFLDHRIEAVRFNHERFDNEDEIEVAVELRDAPAFGYNAMHVGGWWTGDRSWFSGRTRDAETDLPVHVEARSIAAVRRPDTLITFATAGLRETGVYRFDRNRTALDDGSHLVLPPILASSDVWGLPRDPANGAGDRQALEVYGFGPDGTIPNT